MVDAAIDNISECVKIQDATLFLGDCLEIMQAHVQVDHVITDPPYARDVYMRAKKLNNSSLKGLSRYYKNSTLREMAAGAIGHMDDMRPDAAEQIARLSKRWSIVFSDAESTHLWRENLTTHGLEYVRTGAWVKPNAIPQMSGDRPGVGIELCTICHPKGKKRWNAGGNLGIWICNIEHSQSKSRPQHPCPKPLSLMEELVSNFSDDNETILDPFMGSGTTGVACAKLGRKFIGIEIQREYFEVACERIDAVYSQGTLF